MLRGCAFCTISAHQGKFIACRSKESILKEVKEVVQLPDFKGYLSDLGGPSANMYGMHGKNLKACERCKRPSCIHPAICPNLNADHSAILDIYHAVDALPQIKRVLSAVVYAMTCCYIVLMMRNPTKQQSNIPANLSAAMSADD